jgi:hypothetical protein
MNLIDLLFIMQIGNAVINYETDQRGMLITSGPMLSFQTKMCIKYTNIVISHPVPPLSLVSAMQPLMQSKTVLTTSMSITFMLHSAFLPISQLSPRTHP